MKEQFLKQQHYRCLSVFTLYTTGSGGDITVSGSNTGDLHTLTINSADTSTMTESLNTTGGVMTLLLEQRSHLEI